LKKRKIGKKDVIELDSIVIDAKPVIKLKEKMRVLCEEGVALVDDIENRKSQKLLVNLVKSMLEDI
jgi:hypothetical protein